jgi:hypothetical protein
VTACAKTARSTGTSSRIITGKNSRGQQSKPDTRSASVLFVATIRHVPAIDFAQCRTRRIAISGKFGKRGFRKLLMVLDQKTIPELGHAQNAIGNFVVCGEKRRSSK